MHATIATAAIALLLAGCSVVGIRSGYEEPDYTVVERIDEDTEIRRYGPRLAAEATVDAAEDEDGRNQAFRLLFDYISGANQGGSEVAMTVPVETARPEEIAPRDVASGEIAPEEIAMTVPVEAADAADGTTTMRFFLPSQFTAETAPQPTDPRVRIVEEPEATLAVLRFSGLGRQERVRQQEEVLRGIIEGTSWQIAGEPTTLFYDPPWTLPFLRRNEAVIPVIAAP